MSLALILSSCVLKLTMTPYRKAAIECTNASQDTTIYRHRLMLRDTQSGLAPSTNPCLNSVLDWKTLRLATMEQSHVSSSK